MKKKIKAVKVVFSCFLILAIFLTLHFILIKEQLISADITAVFYETIDHGLTPSETVKAVWTAESRVVQSGYIFFPPDDQKTDEQVTETVGGINGVPKVKYNDEDLYWLSRIIYAEAGTEPFEGMVAVGSVVMNRVASDSYPDTVYEVIFDKKFGVQFTPAATGTVYRTPSRDAITAAKICLCGYSVSDEILFFLNERIATSTWTRDNCQYVMTIGNHDFYA
ncbi:MAG: cell wall hydrolase [Clostridia bacterium]|nr:cell wall hydrolase [Clostridia bacterium]